MFSFQQAGDFKKTEAALKKMANGDIFSVMNRLGATGVAALSGATPVDSGATASSWSFKAGKVGGGYEIIWTNSNMAGGAPVAILLQYGHGTGTGGYVSGRDYINPAIRPTFDKIADEVWRAVKSA